jgi:tetratricopeptide (TPR) repeat protein
LQSLLSSAHLFLSLAYFDQGKLDEAWYTCDAALTFAQQVFAANPRNPHLQDGLECAYRWLGRICLAKGELSQAVDALQQAADLCRKLTQQCPEKLVWRGHLSMTWCYLAVALRRQNQLAEAAAQIRDSVALARQVMEHDSTNAERRMDFGIALREASELYIAQGRLPEARSPLDESVAVARQNAAMDASNAVYRMELVISLRLSGHLARIEGRSDDAHAALSQAVGIAMALAVLDPTNMTWRRELEAVKRECGMLTHAASL